MTLSSLSFVVFLHPYQGIKGVCLLSKYVVFLVWGIVTLPSLSPYSNKVLIPGAHRWETANTYLQDIYCIVKPWIQKNKSISQIKMCMCGEWMMYGDDGNNNGERCRTLVHFYLSSHFFFLSRFRALAPFYFLVFFFLFFFFPFFRALISWNNIASGSNQDNLSIYFTGKNRNVFGYSLPY